MNIKRRKRHAAEVATGSLNDIMFFLLLFFLIISTLVNPNVIKLTLPNSKKSSTVNKTTITITVTNDLQYFLNNKPISFGELENALSMAVASNKEAPVVLRFDNSLSVQDLVDVLQIGDRLKVKMILATKTSNG